MTSRDESLAALEWLIDAGADEAIGEAPVDRLTAKPRSVRDAGPSSFREGEAKFPRQSTAATPGQSPKTASAQSTFSQREAGRAAAPRTPVATTPGDDIGNAQALAASAGTLEELKTALIAFDGSELKRAGANTVFADGTPAHRIMLIGEAPGADEDRAGLPFVGRAGQLLDKMLASINLSRKTNVYITNVLNWRPPGNRDPAPEEAAVNLPFLRRHIELVDPGIIVLLGASAARHVMGRSDGIMRLRGKWLDYHVNGRMVPVMPTLHPAYLLRRPVDKKLAWRDLQAIEGRIHDLNLLEAPASGG